MINSFKHKGLQKFFSTGSTAGIGAGQEKKLRLKLAALHAANEINDLERPGYFLHPLTGERKGEWAITVTGNWRITFKFFAGNAYIVNYEDYH